MESVVHKIRFMRSKMGRAEKKIAEYMLENTERVPSLSVSELSKLAGCGDATVVRFSRRLGFEGYQALRIAIAAELSSASSISSQILKTDSCLEIFRKRINDISVALWNTESVLDAKNLEMAASFIANAKRVVVFGLGSSASVAQDAAHKLMRLGLYAQACCDNHMQAIIASHLDRECVAIGVSHSGASKDIIEALRLARDKKAKTVCVTNYSDSPIVKESDVPLYTKSQETAHSILAMSSRIAQLAIFDAIYTYIVTRANKSAIAAIYDTETALWPKKITED